MRRNFYGALFAIVLTALICTLMLQERLIFFPEKLGVDHKFDFKNSREINFYFEGKNVSSILFPSESPFLLLYFHGNAGSLRSWGEVGEEIRDKTQAGIWVVDYPGYGKSAGRIYSEQQLFAFAERFYEIAKAEFPFKRLVIYGRSIGTGAAVHLAVKTPLPLILESPFASFSQLASELAPWFPSFLSRYHFENLKTLESYTHRLLLVHGANDEIIPVHHAKKIAQELKHVEYTEIPDGRHNDLSSFSLYWKALSDFLKALEREI